MIFGVKCGVPWKSESFENPAIVWLSLGTNINFRTHIPTGQDLWVSIEQLCLAQKGFLLGHMMQNWGVGQKFTSTYWVSLEDFSRYLFEDLFLKTSFWRSLFEDLFLKISFWRSWKSPFEDHFLKILEISFWRSLFEDLLMKISF